MANTKRTVQTRVSSTPFRNPHRTNIPAWFHRPMTHNSLKSRIAITKQGGWPTQEKVRGRRGGEEDIPTAHSHVVKTSLEDENGGQPKQEPEPARGAMKPELHREHSTDRAGAAVPVRLKDKPHDKIPVEQG
jgi:hypothetical protein